MNGILFCFIMIRKLGRRIMVQVSYSLRPVHLVVVVVVLAAHTPPPCLWQRICLWGCMVNRTGSFCGLNITRSPFLPLVTTTKDIKDYVYPDLFPIWFTAVSQKLQWHGNKQWLVEDGLLYVYPSSPFSPDFSCGKRLLLCSEIHLMLFRLLNMQLQW